MYITNYNYILKIFKNLLLTFSLGFSLTSCSLTNILNNEKQLKDIKKQQISQAQIKCPKFYIPSKTSKYLNKKYNYQYLLKIKKINLICKKIPNNGNNQLVLLLDYKAEILLTSKNDLDKKKLFLPKLYIAFINDNDEKVLAKVFSNLDIENINNNLIINEKKFKFKYNKDNNLNIYFGLQ